jgi:GNAT superfamily N-acetyltransferase
MKFSLFYSAPFLAVLKKVYDLREIPVLDPEQDGYVPFLSSNKPLKQSLIFNLPFNFYQTAEYLRSCWQGHEWSKIKEHAKKQRKNITITTVGDAGIDRGDLFAFNSILDLSDVSEPAEKYSRNLAANLRTEWNKCHKYGITIGASRAEIDLQSFYRVLSRQYVREHRMVFQPFALYKSLLALGVGTLIVAKQDDQLVGGMFLLADGEVLHYSWGARSRIKNVSIGTVLVDYAIRYAKAQGHTMFDFGSTPLSDGHLLDFKARWGSSKYPVFKYYTIESPSQIDLGSSYQLARRLYSCVPIRVAASLMPAVVPWLVS